MLDFISVTIDVIIICFRNRVGNSCEHGNQREERYKGVMQQDWRRCDSSVDDIFQTVAAAAESTSLADDRKAPKAADTKIELASKQETLQLPSMTTDTSTNPSLRSPILSSNRRTSSNVSRGDKHVRLTLPHTAPSPIPSGRCSTLQPRLSILAAATNGIGVPVTGGRYYRRRRAVSSADFKSCAMVQNKMKLGDIMWVQNTLLIMSIGRSCVAYASFLVFFRPWGLVPSSIIPSVYPE